nr:unnamed protein product [Callosobruchus analis]
MKPSRSSKKGSKTIIIHLERPKQLGKLTPSESKHLSERIKRKSRSSSLQSQPKKDDDLRAQSPLPRAKSEASYYEQYKKRVQSLSPAPRAKKVKGTSSEKEKPQETQKYDNILEEKECEDCFSAEAKPSKDVKSEGTKKASGGGSGSTGRPSKKKSNLVINLILPKVELKKDDPSIKLTSTPSVPEKGGTAKKRDDDGSAPPKSLSPATVSQEKPLATSVTPATNKPYRLDDFVCADCFVKATEEAKESEKIKDPQSELKQLLDDPYSKILSSKYLLRPQQQYAKSCRLDELESDLSDLLTPEQGLKDAKTEALTSDTQSKKSGTKDQPPIPADSSKQDITMMDKQEFKGTFVDQKLDESKSQALLKVTATFPKPKPQEDESGKQTQAPAKFKPGKPSKKCIITLSRSPYMPIINLEKPKITYRVVRRRTYKSKFNSTRGRMHKPKKEISNSVIAKKMNQGVTACKEMGINLQKYQEIYLRVIMEKYRIDEIRLKEDECSVPRIDIEFLKRRIRKEKMRRAMERKVRRFFEGPKSGNPAVKSKPEEFSKEMQKTFVMISKYIEKPD